MTTLHNHITINASPQQVWEVLSDLELLAQFDPVVDSSKLITEMDKGLGAQRLCETKGGWFKEEVQEWQPFKRLSFRLFDCNLPMKDLTHTYTLEAKGHQTEVSQVMTYKMKYGFLGKLLDLMVVRKSSDKGIRLFFQGLKQQVESIPTL